MYHIQKFSIWILSTTLSSAIRRLTQFVFLSRDNLLHTIGKRGHQPGMFDYPQGVAIAQNGRLFCVSWNVNYDLHILY